MVDGPHGAHRTADDPARLGGRWEVVAAAPAGASLEGHRSRGWRGHARRSFDATPRGTYRRRSGTVPGRDRARRTGPLAHLVVAAPARDLVPAHCLRRDGGVRGRTQRSVHRDPAVQPWSDRSSRRLACSTCGFLIGGCSSSARFAPRSRSSRVRDKPNCPFRTKCAPSQGMVAFTVRLVGCHRAGKPERSHRGQ